MASADKYILKVTAGHSYDPKDHQQIEVNKETPVRVNSDHIEANINVRIQNYRGLPHGSPSTSPYFSHASRTYDRYSVAFTFTPKESFSGDHVVFGNDFDHPIRDKLPWFFERALNFIKGWIDPGLDGDAYADEPYLYGPLLSSINVLSIGEKGSAIEKDKAGERAAELIGEADAEIFEEGAVGEEAKNKRQEKGIPDDPKGRRNHFLNEEKRKDFEFEKGRIYACDFFNPYLDFNDFSLKLPVPGLSFQIIRYWDGQPLRYVLKDRSTNTVLFVISFTLLPVEDEMKDAISTKDLEQEPDHPTEDSHKEAWDKLERGSFEDPGVD